MNKNNKQVVALALAFFVGFSVFFSAPSSVFASDLSYSLSYWGNADGSSLINLDFIYSCSSDVFMIGVPYKINNQKSCTYMFVSLSPFQANSKGHFLSTTYSGGTNFSVNSDNWGSFDRFYYNFFAYYICSQNDFSYKTFYDAVPYHITCLQDMNVGSGIDTLEEFKEYFSGEVADAIYSLLNGCPNENVESSSSSMYVNAVDELGYIQNITTATKNVNLMNANQHSIPVIKFSFSTTTSTGKKIYEEGMDVQYMLTARSFESESDYSQKNVYKSAKSDLFFVSKNPNIYDEENSLNKGFFNFSAASDTWQSMYSDLKDGMSLFANMVYDREFFIRPVYRESIFSPIKYGGWSRVVIDAFGKTHVIEGTVEGGENNPSAVPDSDGQLDDDNNQYDSDHKQDRMFKMVLLSRSYPL